MNFPSPAEWAEQNFSGCNLGDVRRTQRLVRAAARCAELPEASLPGKFSWNPLRAVYRLANRPEVSHAAVAEPHFARTRQSMADRPRTLILHDTSELDFTYHHALVGHGPIGNGGGRGFLEHNSLAVDPDTHEVLGLAFQQLTVRVPAPVGEKTSQRLKRPRESDLWVHGLRGVGPAPRQASWIDVADCGGDIYRAMAVSQEMGHDFLIRAAQDRKVLIGPSHARKTVYLKTYARTLKPQIRDTVEVAGRGQRPSRIARLRLAAAAVTVPAANVPATADRPEIPCRVVRIWEPEPPADRQPVEWILLTSVRTESDAELLERRNWYTDRWLLEEFHKVEKTGCGVERLCLRTADGLAPMVALMSVTAVRVLQLRQMARARPQAPAREAAGDLEIRMMRAIGGHKGSKFTVRDFVHGVAKLGGFLGRRSDGEPGWQTLWRGYRRLQDMVRGCRLLQASPKHRGPPEPI